MNWLHAVGRAAVRALYAEISLEPKPGLVSFRDTGSHCDMDASTFMRSLFSLRHYFPAMAQAGYHAARFDTLQSLGLQAEARMLMATGGINTHRGAVFGLGLLCASAGQVRAQGLTLTPHHLRTVLLATWGQALAERAEAASACAPRSHGQTVARRYGLRSAGAEAALGFPCLLDITWPSLQQALATGLGERAARVHALFATIAVLDDTNLVHRGGMPGLRLAQGLARQFLAAGGSFQPHWVSHARSVHATFVQHRLSPGGAADVLASACWMQSMCQSAPLLRAPVERVCLDTQKRLCLG
ncbi:triphosphoribosyl-dephospho-CoA synthase MdcB [Rhodoferax sp.]|uniref:triphosphoribosyl-dephospho-CoA synthase MdcB n=1 Tax=Rhodoferax sp. TaxID=50421 RepID=UPI00261D3D4F|nr:triphosphoribosyl-dephospho-CoA synthase MdcB [Rhodoferax sp.]MDD2810393.1 triphosphoribosyl-dephospho-CoA synthase MdcB [Rhodoferax sp.]MDD4943196.1 triphosphoribosyl-dephospho-CoA synthase MdcB [Rhodoferax sp.]